MPPSVTLWQKLLKRPTRVYVADAKAFADVLERHGVHVRTLGVGRTAWRPLQLIRAGLRLRWHVRARRADIVHAHMVHANLLSRIALRCFTRNANVNLAS
jgi:hypothetical protein